MNAGTAEVGTEIGKARKVAHTTPQALAACAGQAVAVPQFETVGVTPRRVEADGTSVFECGPLRLTPGWLGDLKTGRRIAVTRIQMRMLQSLMVAAGEVVTVAGLVPGKVWGKNSIGGANAGKGTVSVHMTTLRRKMADIRTMAKIRNHPGIGYSIEWPGMVVRMSGTAYGKRDTAHGAAGEAA